MKNRDEREIKTFLGLLEGAHWQQRDQKAKVIEDWTKRYIEPGIEECKSLKTEITSTPMVRFVEQAPSFDK